MATFDLKGKTAVVVGGTTGLGKELSLGLASAGATVIASSRNVDAVNAVAIEIAACGVETMRAITDVRDRSSIQRLHDDVIKTFGRVDILLNCAGITQRISTLDCPETLWNDIMDVNVNGTLRACQIFGKSMLERGYGKIINVASLSSFVAFHEVAAYGASKAAVAALTRSLAVEWSSHGVCVNAIAPGIFPTALNESLLDSPRGAELKMRTPMKRFGIGSELVSTAIYLSLDASSFVTGQIISVDGGFMASGVNQ
jgi:NAD(P)-dependent dehydrogenase (short-subunit alcohol dehydrogenase family)